MTLASRDDRLVAGTFASRSSLLRSRCTAISLNVSVNSFVIDIVIKGENFVSEPAPPFLVVSHPDGPLEVKPVPN
jgi:hypothetical protein